jgi:hypothetical protein
VRRLGVDAATGAARITEIPRPGADRVSKRTMNGTVATRNYASGLSLDWDTVDASLARRSGRSAASQAG